MNASRATASPARNPSTASFGGSCRVIDANRAGRRAARWHGQSRPPPRSPPPRAAPRGGERHQPSLASPACQFGQSCAATSRDWRSAPVSTHTRISGRFWLSRAAGGCHTDGINRQTTEEPKDQDSNDNRKSRADADRNRIAPPRLRRDAGIDTDRRTQCHRTGTEEHFAARPSRLTRRGEQESEIFEVARRVRHRHGARICQVLIRELGSLIIDGEKGHHRLICREPLAAGDDVLTEQQDGRCNVPLLIRHGEERDRRAIRIPPRRCDLERRIGSGDTRACQQGNRAPSKRSARFVASMSPVPSPAMAIIARCVRLYGIHATNVASACKEHYVRRC